MIKTTEEEIQTIISTVLWDVAISKADPAPSGPAPASQEPVLLPGEPILFEKDGWGIYTNVKRSDSEGGTLTHIGCDCDFPYWTFAYQIPEISDNFRCAECEEVLPRGAYEDLLRVYKFLNNL